MVSFPSARLSLSRTTLVRATAELLVEPAGMVTVISLPAAGAVKSAASALAVPSVLKERVMVVAALNSTLWAVEANLAVTMASPALASASSAMVVPKSRVIWESSSTMSKATSLTGRLSSAVPPANTLSRNSAAESSVKENPVRAAVLLSVPAAGMVMVMGAAGSVTSPASAVTESSEESPASFTSSMCKVITVGEVRSEVTPLRKEALALTVPRSSPSVPPV